MQLSGSRAFYEPLQRTDEYSPKYIKTGSLTSLSSNQAQKAINYIKGKRQAVLPQN